jgi:hypothetical protein
MSFIRVGVENITTYLPAEEVDSIVNLYRISQLGFFVRSASVMGW